MKIRVIVLNMIMMLTMIIMRVIKSNHLNNKYN